MGILGAGGRCKSSAWTLTAPPRSKDKSQKEWSARRVRQEGGSRVLPRVIALEGRRLGDRPRGERVSLHPEGGRPGLRSGGMLRGWEAPRLGDRAPRGAESLLPV